MNAIRNKVQLIGQIADIPQVTTIADAKKKAAFTVETMETFKNGKGEKITDSQFHRIIAWGKLAEIAEKYLGKGTEVAIEGKLVNDGYTDHSGTVRYISVIHANELLILTKK
jgi:single-strand DNA-binding protein